MYGGKEEKKTEVNIGIHCIQGKNPCLKARKKKKKEEKEKCKVITCIGRNSLWRGGWGKGVETSC